MTVYLFEDAKCTKILEDDTKEMTAEEAAKTKCHLDNAPNHSIKYHCDAVGYHVTSWYASKNCTGKNFHLDLKWDECTKVSNNKWTMVKKAGEPKLVNKPAEDKNVEEHENENEKEGGNKADKDGAIVLKAATIGLIALIGSQF